MDGEPVRSWDEMFRALGVADTSWGQDVTNGRVIPAQSRLGTLQAAGGERAARVREKYLADAPRLAFALCYCSVYDECWRLRAQGLLAGAGTGRRAGASRRVRGGPAVGVPVLSDRQAVRTLRLPRLYIVRWYIARSSTSSPTTHFL